MSARQDDWDTYLVYIEFAYNNSFNAATGFSPFVLQFEQSPRAPWIFSIQLNLMKCIVVTVTWFHLWVWILLQTSQRHGTLYIRMRRIFVFVMLQFVNCASFHKEFEVETAL
jgi:hypothetical protein